MKVKQKPSAAAPEIPQSSLEQYVKAKQEDIQVRKNIARKADEEKQCVADVNRLQQELDEYQKLLKAIQMEKMQLEYLVPNIQHRMKSFGLALEAAMVDLAALDAEIAAELAAPVADKSKPVEKDAKKK